jgi:hypothetical protein
MIPPFVGKKTSSYSNNSYLFDAERLWNLLHSQTFPVGTETLSKLYDYDVHNGVGVFVQRDWICLKLSSWVTQGKISRVGRGSFAPLEAGDLDKEISVVVQEIEERNVENLRAEVARLTAELDAEHEGVAKLRGDLKAVQGQAKSFEKHFNYARKLQTACSNKCRIYRARIDQLMKQVDELRTRI